jgi:hypothetical protein
MPQLLRESAGLQGDIGKRCMHQLDPGPVALEAGRGMRQALASRLQRPWVLIEANQTTLWAEALCDSEAVPAQSQGGVDIRPAGLDRQKVDRFF